MKVDSYPWVGSVRQLLQRMGMVRRERVKKLASRLPGTRDQFSVLSSQFSEAARKGGLLYWLDTVQTSEFPPFFRSPVSFRSRNDLVVVSYSEAMNFRHTGEGTWSVWPVGVNLPELGSLLKITPLSVY